MLKRKGKWTCYSSSTSPGADPDSPIGGAQIFHPVRGISGGQTGARSARESRAKLEPRAKPET